MSNSKIITGIIGASLLLLIGGVYFASKAPQPPEIQSSSQVNIDIEETSFNWGTIPLTGGKVEKIFIINNSGSDPLQLANVKTSCMCTQAQLIIDGQKSPNFGMHSNSSWSGEVESGKKAELKVIFDPAFHGPSGTGQISRVITVETNDQNNPTLEFRLTANVIN